MKKIKTGFGILAFILIILISGCISQNPTTRVVSNEINNNENLRVAEIELPGMFCQACAQSSESTFRGMVGVVDAEVDIGTKKARVIYDSGVITKEQLVQDGLIQAYDGEILNDQEYNL